MILEAVRRFFATFVGLFFPRTCFVCGAEGAWLCSSCAGTLDIAGATLCPGCGVVTAHGEACLQCKNSTALDGLTTFTYYHEDSAVARLIRAIKYRRAFDVASALPTIWRLGATSSALQRLAPLRSATLVPVPLHRGRFKDRGFNQSHLITESLGKFLERPVLGRGLVRTRRTEQQTKLSRDERQKNVTGAFAWQWIEKPPENIILIDDVYTTGATMNEAAKALKAAGAKFVWGCAVARG